MYRVLDHIQSSSRACSHASAGSCHRLLSRIQSTKHELLKEFRPRIAPHDRMLQLASNEAEGLARQTDFPLLVFPTLAREKAEAISAWKVRQQRMRGQLLQSFAA